MPKKMKLFKEYDVLIIGAGPSGLFCAYELSRNTNMRIAILDAGKSYKEKKCPLLAGGGCVNCRPCSTLAGEGGSAFFHAGKLSFYPAGSGIRRILKTETACEKIYMHIKDIYEAYGISLKNQDQKRDSFFESYKQKGMDIKYYQSIPVEQSDFQKFICLFGEDLRSRITMLMETEVLDVEKKKSGWRIKADKKGIGMELLADRLVIATGEYGFRWWQRIAGKLGVKRKNQKVDIGIRIECPSLTMEKIWPYHKDLKAKVTAPDGSELRTYCVLKNGLSVYCNYGDYIVLDGISEQGSSVAGITIFNRLGEKQLKGENPIDFVTALLKDFYHIHKKPVCTSMGTFLGKGLQQFSQYGICTLPNIEKMEDGIGVPELPPFIYENLKFGIHEFDKLIPGILDPKNGVLMPVMDNLWSELELSEYMETSIQGLYVTGDATGKMRGIMQACVTGVLCADGIVEYTKENQKWENCQERD